MALHTELPIHKTAYDLLGLVVDYVKHMNRDYKQSLGWKLRDECLEILASIYRANCAAHKRPDLDAVVERTQLVVLLLRLARDKGAISSKQLARTMPLTQGIGKQAVGWRRSATSPVS